MVDFIVILGASGVVGRQLTSCIRDSGLPFTLVSASNLSQLDDDDFFATLNRIALELQTRCSNLDKLGVILAHRVRDLDIIRSLRCELRISRDLVWFFSEHFSFVNVVVLGSVTGRLIDKSMPDAYHISKDVQKSCARLSVKIPNVAMNVLELGWFEKYPPQIADCEYAEALKTVQREIGLTSLPTINDIASFMMLLLSAESPPRGQVITYDGGYSMIQH